MQDIFKSIFAGICIGIAGTVYLKVGGLPGAVLFSFGLIAAVSLKLWLFTGMAYRVWAHGHIQLLMILLLNLTGCLLVTSVVTNPELTNMAENIITQRLSQGAVKCGLLSVGCGFIMTLAVTRVKKYNNWWPLLFGVPTFIICGFPHCVADAFYIQCCSWQFIDQNIKPLVAFYGMIVAGNYFGCNLYRLSNYMNKNESY